MILQYNVFLGYNTELSLSNQSGVFSMGCLTQSVQMYNFEEKAESLLKKWPLANVIQTVLVDRNRWFDQIIS